MEQFVKILTIFEKAEDRTIFGLASKYCESELLINYITRVFDKDLIISGKRVLLKPNWVCHSKKKIRRE